ncbi:FR47-like protein [Micromonospora nigra]|uniref:FR47-like protein n=1 Tax=Micromonospora nigra TaxID=145857 RepID=A0A1C6SVW6_9ACTN|nr:GNAT family N-acetyltransferase [Micromonospora nigra]SCL33670.1 FR47-like protein [Micromonospora nigra]
MIIADEALDGRDTILAATGHHPFSRHALRPGGRVRGWRRDATVTWLPLGEPDPPAGALGAPGPALGAVVGLAADRLLRPGQRLHLPRLDAATLAQRPSVAAHADWDFLWTTTPPPRQPDEERVVRLGEADLPALSALIEQAFPTTTSRPGDPRVVGWYGVREGDRLVACGADRSRGDVGFLAGLTVAPDRRGRGLGATLTAAMTRAVAPAHGLVALGVYTVNVAAIRLYQRLGYTHRLALSSVRLPD